MLKTMSCGLVLATGWVGDWDSCATAAPMYEFRAAFLDDAEHTAPNGRRYALTTVVAPPGVAIGSSYRLGSPPDFGSTAYAYDAVANRFTTLGLPRSEFYSDSLLPLVSANGRTVVGTSGRTDYSDAAWMADLATGTTWPIGPDDRRARSVTLIDPSDRVAGYSFVPNASRWIGTAAWYYDRSTGETFLPGLFDSPHTHPSGRRESEPTAFLGDGRLAGQSARYVGGAESDDFTNYGRTPWVFDPATGETRVIVPVGAEFTDGVGFRDSRFVAVRSNGLAAMSSRNSTPGPTVYVGSSAFLADLNSGVLTEVGLFDSEHVRPDGYRTVVPVTLSSSGLMSAYQLRTGTGKGYTALAYDHQQRLTRRIGLTDARHTRADGSQSSFPRRATESRFIVGDSSRFDGSKDLGSSTWFYDDATGATRQIGLYDEDHNRTDGYCLNKTISLNESGAVIGTANRYRAGVANGTSGWYFDADDGITVPLIFSSRSDGYAETRPTFLTADGWVAGSYARFDGATSLGTHAFLWSIDVGFIDLESALVGGLQGTGWSFLDAPRWIDAGGFIRGYGRKGEDDLLPYLLIPVVPEPSSFHILTTVALLACRRRRLAKP